jgi:hypothetical protein
MRRFCTTLQIHSLTAMMLNFWTCQLETRESSTGAQTAADEPAPARVRSHPVPPTAAGECSRARSGVRQPPKDEKINTSSGWHRQGDRGTAVPHLLVCHQPVELRGKKRLAVRFTVGHTETVATSCASCTAGLMSKSRTQQGPPPPTPRFERFPQKRRSATAGLPLWAGRPPPRARAQIGRARHGRTVLGTRLPAALPRRSAALRVRRREAYHCSRRCA